MLSITKLEQLLGKKGFVPVRYFTIHKYTAYMEVISIHTSATYMLSIPSKYKFKLRESENVFKLRHIKVDLDTSTTDEFAGTPDDLQVEKTYTEVQLTNMLERKKENDQGNIAGHLEEGYKRPISVKDMSKEDMKDIRNLVRQVKRLKYCVMSLGYKIMLMYKNYMCVLDKDDSVECFFVKHLPAATARRLIVTVDLEFYYENADRLENDIVEIEAGIIKVLNKNQEAHASNIKHMIDNHKNIVAHSNNVLSKKKEYTQYMSRFTQMLASCNKAEKVVIEKIYNLDADAPSGGMGDTEYAQKKGALENDLSKIHDIKGKIINSMNDIKEKQDNLALILDTVFFDNLVMTDRILRNLDFVRRVTDGVA